MPCLSSGNALPNPKAASYFYADRHIQHSPAAVMVPTGALGGKEALVSGVRNQASIYDRQVYYRLCNCLVRVWRRTHLTVQHVAMAMTALCHFRPRSTQGDALSC